MRDDAGHEWIDLVNSTQKKKSLNAKFRRSSRRERNQVVFDRDCNKCLKCGSEENLTIDHIQPKSKGGSNDDSNKQTLCWACNHEKDDNEIDYRIDTR